MNPNVKSNPKPDVENKIKEWRKLAEEQQIKVNEMIKVLETQQKELEKKSKETVDQLAKKSNK